MNLTLHLTENCNMNCAYCVREKQPLRMSEAVVDAAVDLAFSSGKNAGLCFFGGEPLLETGLIYRAIRRCMLKTIETGKPAYYKMTTNGTLLTERFLENAHAVRMGIGLSFEGLAQDTCRRFQDGAVFPLYAHPHHHREKMVCDAPPLSGFLLRKRPVGLGGAKHRPGPGE